MWLLFPSPRAGFLRTGERVLMARRWPLPASNEGFLQDHEDQVPVQEHLRCVTVHADWLGRLLPLATLGDLGPHLLHILQHHVAVPVEGRAHEFHVVVVVDEHLGVVLNGLCEHGEGVRVKLLLLPFLQLLQGHLAFGLVGEAHGGGLCAHEPLPSPPCCFCLWRGDTSLLLFFNPCYLQITFANIY